MAGIYIHIPFCRQACTYCNFHFSTSLSLKDDFCQALIKEILLVDDENITEIIETIYFGGGTPSLLSITDLKMIFDALNKKFTISKDAEITLEANPDDINPDILREWNETGINRLSLGVQSFNEEELRWMNRAHTAAESIKSIDEILSSPIKNFSVDLIFGSPMTDDSMLEKHLEIIFKKNIPHISCYALTVEPKTVLHNQILKKQSLPVDPERQANQFLLLMDKMKANNYEHYEISNFALPGMRSKHNSSYWQGKKYFGFGPSAHSFNGFDKRKWNVANNALYIQSIKNGKIPIEEEILTSTQRLNEYIMTSLRTIEGVDLTRIENEFGEHESIKLLQSSEEFLKRKMIMLEDQKLKLTREGKLYADGIAAELFF